MGKSAEQSGRITPGHVVKWLTDNVIGDGGGPVVYSTEFFSVDADGNITAVSMTLNSGVANPIFIGKDTVDGYNSISFNNAHFPDSIGIEGWNGVDLNLYYYSQDAHVFYAGGHVTGTITNQAGFGTFTFNGNGFPDAIGISGTDDVTFPDLFYYSQGKHFFYNGGNVIFTLDASGNMHLNMATLINAVDDAAAATAGATVGQVYRNGSVLMVRVT